MASQTISWLITIYYTIRRPCFRAFLVPNNSLFPSKKNGKPVQRKNIVFIVASCILISSKSIIYPQIDFISVLENIEIYIKT